MVMPQKAVESEFYKNKSAKFLETIDISPKNISLYVLCFIHRSIVNERPDFAPNHNERLEFLWDAVLELVVTDKLFHDFPEKPEWELTDIRSAIVRWKNLALIWRELKFAEYLFLWKWEEKTWWRENDYILANTVEALIWAIYLDLGISEAKSFILKYIYTSLDWILEQKLTKDFKTLFQEFSQSKFESTPEYKLISETWPDHEKNFKVWVMVNKNVVWEWSWTSKKKAQEDAAKNAYLKLTKK